MELYECPKCHREVEKKDTDFTYDVCGIPFKRYCRECANEIMETYGYDGRDYRHDHCESIW